jgi:predicted nucleic acid-binding protein
MTIARRCQGSGIQAKDDGREGDFRISPGARLAAVNSDLPACNGLCLIDRSRILGPKQLTDIYLLALAVKHSGRLVTFDRAIPIVAVRGAQADHVVLP